MLQSILVNTKEFISKKSFFLNSILLKRFITLDRVDGVFLPLEGSELLPLCQGLAALLFGLGLSLL